MTSKLLRVFEQIDTINAEDPHIEYVEGIGYPKELLYGQRMSSMLENFTNNPSESLQIATRGQHVKRWIIPRSDYPMDRKGYLKWRSDLKLFHCKLMEEIMLNCDYKKPEILSVKNLLMKKNLKTNPDAQTLEDIACLVFLQYYLNEFAATKDDGKIIAILRKTWDKMSEKGHRAAKKLRLPEKVSDLISSALGPQAK